MASSSQSRKPTVHLQMVPPPLQKTLSGLSKGRQSFSLVDLGCGSGELLYCLKKGGYLKKAQLFALDIDQKALQAVKEKLPEAKVILTNVLNLESLKTNFFDFVICNQVIEHVEDDQLLVSEISRILKKGGLVYITSVLKKWYGLYWHRNQDGRIAIHPDHRREYSSPQEFKNLLTQGRLKIKHLTVSSSSFPLGDYFLLFLAKIGLLKFTSLRDYYLQHPKIWRLSNRFLFPPIPGYATLEALAEKQ